MKTLEWTDPVDPSRFLRHSLRANAVFSTLSGLGFLVASPPIAAYLGDVPPRLVAGVGAQLVLFAAALVWLASRPTLSRPLTVGVILADLAWVLGTAAVVQADLLSSPGTTLVIVIADVVLTLAMLQAFGLYKMAGRRREARS
jgi:hypothetical protein